LIRELKYFLWLNVVAICQSSATREFVLATWASLRKTLGSGYRFVQQTDSELALGRLLPGDAYEVRITPSTVSGQQLAISVHFVARPD
jgi:hypothetical protein